MTTVGAVMIVRDEAHFLSGCLDSLVGAVDEVVVVDTGSVDATREIAHAARATVYDWTWTSDFSAARNFAIEKSRCDWLLYIDADERLRKPTRSHLGTLLQSDALAAKVSFQPRSGFTRYGEWRLFRCDNRIRFRGAIHETIVPAVRAIASDAQILEIGVEIDHLGYEVFSQRKLHRNLPLLKCMVREQPERIYYRKELAETLFRLGSGDEAIEIAHHAIFDARLQGDPESRAAASLIFQFLINETRASSDEKEELLRAADENFPEDSTLWLMQAHNCLARKQPRDALAWTARLLSAEPDSMRFGLLAHDRRIFGDKAHEAEALAHLQLGDRRRAARSFQLASELCPENASHRLRAAALQ